ncbi:MAG: hypothetical protein UT57_C0032G0002 [Microgenomates group bacterium GW2011_GWC1_39_7]|nr:MAG: hypothetical protein UT57_C0032G0002 [Microgenomates group bacterium GW2011_GWC1_39_7]
MWKKKGELGRDYTFEVFYDCNEFDLNSSRVIPDIFVWCLLDSSHLLRFQIDDQLSGLQDWSLHWADAIVKAYLQTDKRARKKAVITRVTEAVDSMTSEIDQITSPLKPSYTQIE